MRNALLAAAAVLLVFCVACDSGTSPVAPEGTLLTINANPTTIPTNGTSAIQVVARHPSGVPARTGTEIRFVTNLGSIEEVVRTDSDGVARATLMAGDQAGTARVVASSGVDGGAVNSDEVEVEVEKPAPGPSPPELKADFEWEATGLKVIFRDLSTGSIDSWRWRFGDEKKSKKREPVHKYPEAGTYVVRLTVRDGDGEKATTRQFVTVSPEDEE